MGFVFVVCRARGLTWSIYLSHVSLDNEKKAIRRCQMKVSDSITWIIGTSRCLKWHERQIIKIGKNTPFCANRSWSRCIIARDIDLQRLITNVGHCIRRENSFIAYRCLYSLLLLFASAVRIHTDTKRSIFFWSRFWGRTKPNLDFIAPVVRVAQSMETTIACFGLPKNETEHIYHYHILIKSKRRRYKMHPTTFWTFATVFRIHFSLCFVVKYTQYFVHFFISFCMFFSGCESLQEYW